MELIFFFLLLLGKFFQIWNKPKTLNIRISIKKSQKFYIFSIFEIEWIKNNIKQVEMCTIVPLYNLGILGYCYIRALEWQWHEYKN